MLNYDNIFYNGTTRLGLQDYFSSLGSVTFVDDSDDDEESDRSW